MSANSGCGGFYYCRQRSECVDRPDGSRNTHTHTYHCRWSSLSLRPNAYCRFIDKYLSLLLSHGLMTGQLYLHPWGGGGPYLGTLYKHLQFTIPSAMQECPHLLTFPIHQFMLLGNQHFINAPCQVHFLWLWWISDCFLKMWNVCPMISYWINRAFLALMEIQTVITQPN